MESKLSLAKKEESMHNIKRGSLVYALFPNEENNGEDFSVKLCIILNEELKCAFFVPCTSQVHQDYRYEMSFIIKKDSPEGKQMNLKNDSLVIIDRFDKLPISIIRSIHKGTTPESILKRIERLL